MSLSDCEKCWNTPCVCGWEYRNHTKAYRIKLAAAILGVNQNVVKSIKSIPKIHPKKMVKSVLRV